MRTIFTKAASLLLLAGALAFAKNPQKHFARMDSNHDGRITLDEFRAHAKNPAKADKRFRKLDANGDGALTADEFVNRPAHK